MDRKLSDEELKYLVETAQYRLTCHHCAISISSYVVAPTMREFLENCVEAGWQVFTGESVERYALCRVCQDTLEQRERRDREWLAEHACAVPAQPQHES